MSIYDRQGQHTFAPSTTPSWEAADLTATGRWARVLVDGIFIGSLFTDDKGAVGWFESPELTHQISNEIQRRVLELAGTPADQAYNTVIDELTSLSNVTFEKSDGKLSQLFGGGETTVNDPLSISVNEDDIVVALVDTNGEQPKIRANNTWVEVEVDDPRVDGIPVYSVDDDAIDVWDSGSITLNDYAGVIIDEQ